MEDLSVFDFGEHSVRVMLGECGEPLFVAKDVCGVLGLKNFTQAVASLDDDERAMFNIGRQGKANVITESGLYHLIFKSRKNEARNFRRWVTMEVLPAIRLRGSYSLRRASESQLSLPDWVKGQGYDLKRDHAELMPIFKRAWETAKVMVMKSKAVNERGFLLFDMDVLDVVEAGVRGEVKLLSAGKPDGELQLRDFMSDCVVAEGSVNDCGNIQLEYVFSGYLEWCEWNGVEAVYDGQSSFVRMLLRCKPEWRRRKVRKYLYDEGKRLRRYFLEGVMFNFDLGGAS